MPRECRGTDDSGMKLWLVYSCDGGTDKTTSHSPNCGTGGSGECTDSGDPDCNGGSGECTDPSDPRCNGGVECNDPGNRNHLRIPGCGGSANLVCNGGTISIHQVTSPSTRFPIQALPTRFVTVADGKEGQLKRIWNW